MNKIDINIKSEVNNLNKVIVHEPGFEFELVQPHNTAEYVYNDDGTYTHNNDYLLFDDVIYPEAAKLEHQALCKVIDKLSESENPCIKLTDMLSDILSDSTIRADIIHNIFDEDNSNSFKEKLQDLNNKDLIKAIIRGRDNKGNQFFSHPIINLIFTRDIAFSFGNSTVISWNTKSVRNRENIIVKHLFKHHPALNDNSLIFFHDQYPDLNVEGGDVLVLDSDTICIGISERTTRKSIEMLTPRFISEGFSNILGVELPKRRAQMHLDTVFTQISKSEYLAYTPTLNDSALFRFSESNIKGDSLSHSLLDEVKNINANAAIISCGGESCAIAQKREQWTDGANALAVSPGKIILYERNKYTLNELEKHDYKIYNSEDIVNNNFSLDEKLAVKIDGGELSRGRGGARCLTMPLVRG